MHTNAHVLARLPFGLSRGSWHCTGVTSKTSAWVLVPALPGRGPRAYYDTRTLVLFDLSRLWVPPPLLFQHTFICAYHLSHLDWQQSKGSPPPESLDFKINCSTSGQDGINILL